MPVFFVAWGSIQQAVAAVADAGRHERDKRHHNEQFFVVAHAWGRQPPATKRMLGGVPFQTIPADRAPDGARQQNHNALSKGGNSTTCVSGAARRVPQQDELPASPSLEPPPTTRSNIIIRCHASAFPILPEAPAPIGVLRASIHGQAMR